MLKPSAEIRRQLSRKLRELRRQRQIELRAVSCATGINFATIDNMELERTLLNWRAYKKLLDFYNVRVNIVLEDGLLDE